MKEEIQKQEKMTKGKIVWCLVLRTSKKIKMTSEFGKPTPLILMEEKPLQENVSCKNDGGRGRDDQGKVKEFRIFQKHCMIVTNNNI